MRPALYTFLAGVAIMAFVAMLILPWPTPRHVTACGGTHTTGPNGETKCAGLPRVPSNDVVPRAIDYR